MLISRRWTEDDDDDDDDGDDDDDDDDRMVVYRMIWVLKGHIVLIHRVITALLCRG